VSDGATARRSTYSRFLPAVLRDTGAEPGAFSVDNLLLVTEKILSGLDDGVPVVHANGRPHTHDGIEAVLDRLHQLLDPYRTPVRFLPMLASWLGVEAARSWDDQQLRRAVAGMVPALGLRGLHEGLHRMLDPFDVGDTRPRITLDDGARILFTTPTPGQGASVHALISQGPFLYTRKEDEHEERVVAAYPGLVDPGCIAATPEGHLLVGDDGLPGADPAVRAGVWRVARTGSYVDFTRDPPPRPRPLWPPEDRDADRSEVREGARTGPVLDRPRALAVQRRAGSWEAYVLDDNALFRLGRPDLATLTEVASRSVLGLAAASSAMALDNSGRLLVVDRTDIVVIDPEATSFAALDRHPLRTPGIVPGPLAVLGNHLVVGDLRSKEEPATGPGDTRPADLVLVDRTGPPPWPERRLLEHLRGRENPLISPVALAADGPGSLLVLDLGLRPVSGGSGDPSHKVMAEPAAVFRVLIERPDGVPHPAVTGIERVSAPGRLTNPNGMALVDGTVYLSDPGQPVGEDDNPLVRNLPGHLAVQVHFSRLRTSGVPVEARRRIAHDVSSAVDRHIPAAVVAARPLVPTDPEEGEHQDD
jgi:phage tail-like protein